MKQFLLLALLAVRASAQWIVNDPVNTAVNLAVQTGQAANHVAVMRQWTQQLENLTQQLRQLENQLDVQKRIRDSLGDPGRVGGRVGLGNLGASDLTRSYGETLQEVRRLSSAIESLRRTWDGLFAELDNKTSLGREFVRQEVAYQRYAAVERQADNFGTVQTETAARASVLQADIAATLQQLQAATTQAEADKLTAKLGALQAQLAHVDAVRQAEGEKLRAQQLVNENQAAKERQDFLERQLAEEQQSLGVAQSWQAGIALTPTDYTRP